MKTILFLLIAIPSFGQLTIEPNKVTLNADTMEVKQALAHLRYILPTFHKFKEVAVVKDGVKYYQSRTLFTSIFRRYAYKEENGKLKLVRL